jgi:putative membrane protein
MADGGGLMTQRGERVLVRDLLAATAAVFVWSAIRPADYFTWLLEVAPALIALPILIATRRRFPLTPLAYVLIAIHATILMVGGHYTYAKVPLFDWLRDTLHLARNHYDRLGRLAQGFVPAIIAREVLLRKTPLKPGGWLNFVVVSICLAISACYEFVEWWTALATGAKSDAFLGSQGDPWDTQWDMFCALIGASLAVLTLRRAHDRQVREMVK